MNNKATMGHGESMQPFLLTRMILIYCVAFALLAWLCLPNMHHDMLENYAWGQTFEWGTFKHPPLFSWITRWWFMLWPANTASYYILSYLNDAVALIGVIRLANVLILNNDGKKPNKAQMQIFLLLVLLFSLLSIPYTLYAVKFNADTILLSIWPWTAYAFFSSLYEKNVTRQWLWTIALSVLAAASLLSKYFSGILLLTLLIISLTDTRYRRWYTTPFPYACLTLFILLITPHVLWEYKMNFPFRSYMAEYISSANAAGQTLKRCLGLLNLALSGVYYFLLSWITCFALSRYAQNTKANNMITPINNRLMLKVCFIPVLLVIVIALFSDTGVKERWATPIWFALPILMANALINTLDAIATRLKSIMRAFNLFWLCVFMLIVFSALYVSFFQGGKDNRFSLYEARKEMATVIADRFKLKSPGKTLGWVAGESWPKHAPAVAFYIANHPRALPGFPDEMPALVNPHNTWAQEYGVILCANDISLKTYPVQECIKLTHDWLKSKHLPIVQEELSYHASGWRYFKTIKKQVVVFWVPRAPQYSES